ncbi:hypothetical protein glysoja_050062 [Glycine soja]|uniref:Uncharacterized protein n=1 Tax=Glycine soja TaxID=3848 RepID=A0A0B2QNE3_GLYSO|nr:hypothetical protein glysoja_050062 [Glycine soja]
MAPMAPSHCAMHVGLDSRRRREERVQPLPCWHRWRDGIDAGVQ